LLDGSHLPQQNPPSSFARLLFNANSLFQLKKHSYDLPVADTPVRSFPICGAMLAIWHLRPSLQRRFPLHRHLAKDWRGLCAWCVSDGRKDYASLREIPDLEDYLGREVKLPQLATQHFFCKFG